MRKRADFVRREVIPADLVVSVSAVGFIFPGQHSVYLRSAGFDAFIGLLVWAIDFQVRFQRLGPNQVVQCASNFKVGGVWIGRNPFGSPNVFIDVVQDGFQRFDGLGVRGSPSGLTSFWLKFLVWLNLAFQ